ncbi:hypothetical protein B296_00011870 [Ensete ventricosum]|uniref:Uncharacterized protein n=1 Tax=Ensete ventricosum TaxID=4639 RepID=A0A427B058_ENSVE|nr:hypothetical protein B296_00011870 [Ensete ventricosum]
MIEATEEFDCSSAHIRLRELAKSEDKAESTNVTIKEAKENIINTSPATGWRRPYMKVTICPSIDQGELLREYRGVEVDTRKGRESDDKSKRAQPPKSKTLVKKEVDSEECHNVVEANLPIMKKGTRC